MTYLDELKHRKFVQKLLEKKRKNYEKQMKMNKLSLKENVENGVKQLEFFYKRTNSEYYHEVNKNNTPIKIGGSIVYWINDKVKVKRFLDSFHGRQITKLLIQI